MFGAYHRVGHIAIKIGLDYFIDLTLGRLKRLAWSCFDDMIWNSYYRWKRPTSECVKFRMAFIFLRPRKDESLRM